MDQDSIDKLLETLASACEKQFGFVPSRVLGNMHYTGTDASGRHHFRDSFTRAYIYLTTEPLEVELVNRLDNDGTPFWTKELIADYRKPDGQA